MWSSTELLLLFVSAIIMAVVFSTTICAIVWMLKSSNVSIKNENNQNNHTPRDENNSDQYYSDGSSVLRHRVDNCENG